MLERSVYNDRVKYVCFINFITVMMWGRDSSVGIAGRSGDRIPVGGEIFRTSPDRP